MYSHFSVLVLCAFVATALAVQCTEVTSRSTCSRTIDDQGADCTWCADASGTCGCRRSGLGCSSSVDCSSSSGGGGGSSLSGGAIAGLVIGLLVACACCICIGAFIIGAIVAVVIFVTRRRSSTSGGSAA